MSKNLTIIIILAVILAVSAVGIVVKSFSSGPQQPVQQVTTEEIEKQEQTKPAPKVIIETAEPQDNDLTKEDENFLNMLDMALAEEPNEQMHADANSTEEIVYEAKIYDTQEEPVAVEDTQPEKKMPKWRRIWQNLNITPEEEARIRQGFALAIGRYMAMSPEDQAAERQRLQDMRTRFESMSLEEKNATSQRIFDRFQEWRASGQIELPELTLD